MKATAEEFAFHQRLLAREPTAFAEFAERFYADIVHAVIARAGRGADPVLVEEAVQDTLLDYRDAPARYDPKKLSLMSYLAMAGYRDFQNAQAKERRQTRGHLVMPDPAATHHDIADPRPTIDALIDRIHAEGLWAKLEIALPDPIDRQIALLIVNRVRSWTTYSKTLGIDHLPDDERRLQVKRAKDRITKRLQRIGDNLDE